MHVLEEWQRLATQDRRLDTFTSPQRRGTPRLGEEDVELARHL